MSCISVTVNEVNNKYLWGCYGRSCLERVIFSLMVILMVGVLLIAGLLCVHIGSGGLRRLSSLMFAQANKYENVDTNGLGVLNNAGGHSLQPELVDLMDDGIDIVRIKTTEEVSFLFFLPLLSSWLAKRARTVKTSFVIATPSASSVSTLLEDAFVSTAVLHSLLGPLLSILANERCHLKAAWEISGNLMQSKS